MFSINYINTHLSGRIEGHSDINIHAVNGLQKAIVGEISYLLDQKFEKYLYLTHASAVLVSEDFRPVKPIQCTLIRVSDVRKSFRALLELFKPNDIFEQGNPANQYIALSAKLSENVLVGNFVHISEDVKIGEGSQIGAQVFLGRNVKIGKHVRILPGVKIYNECSIGDRCVIHANAVIGSDGFGYNTDDKGSYHQIPQIGGVIIEEDVEIGANTVIDRSTFGNTLIKRGVKLDNLVQVAHNVEIGEDTVIAAQTGISGSVTLGKGCVVGGQSAFVPHVTVADGNMFQGKCGVSKSIKEPGGKYYGYPAIGFNNYIRSYAVFKQLPELEKKLREMQKEIHRLKEQ